MTALAAPDPAGLLTPAEHDVLEATAVLWNRILAAVPDGPNRTADLRELNTHLHGIQNTFLAQAAARAYPDLYRGLSETTGPSDCP